MKWLRFNCDRIAAGIDNFCKISRFNVVNMQNIAFLYKKLSTIAKCKKEKSCKRGDRFRLFCNYIYRGYIKLKSEKLKGDNREILITGTFQLRFNIDSNSRPCADLALLMGRPWYNAGILIIGYSYIYSKNISYTLYF